jgi:integrase
LALITALSANLSYSSARSFIRMAASPGIVLARVRICAARLRQCSGSLKNKHSVRAVPIHQQLIAVGFLDFAATQRKVRSAEAWLLPEVAPSTAGVSAFSKWFGRYIGAHGVTDPNKVFHSFRHNFTDALRAAVTGDVSRALLGHAQEGVHGRYGAKKIAARYRHRLAEAISSVAYTGLDLSNVAYERR